MRIVIEIEDGGGAPRVETSRREAAPAAAAIDAGGPPDWLVAEIEAAGGGAPGLVRAAAAPTNLSS